MAEKNQSLHISGMRQFKAILKKDIVMELRTKEMLTSMGLYALLVLLIYYIALSQAGREFDVTNIAGGLLWLAIVFTSLLGLNRSLVHEKDQGCLDALLLAPVDRPVIFFGKAIGNLLFLLIVEVFVTPLFMIIFNAGKYSQGPATWGYLALVLLVGSIGIAGVGTLLATMSVNTTGKDFVLAVLFIPIMFPLSACSGCGDMGDTEREPQHGRVLEDARGCGRVRCDHAARGIRSVRVRPRRLERRVCSREGSTMKQIRVALWLAIVGGVMTTVAFLMSFFTAEVQQFGAVTFPSRIDTVFPLLGQGADGFQYARPWFSQKIFYFHVPFAEASFLVFTVAAYFAVRFLMTRDRSYDTKSRVAMEVALLFVVLTLITGDLWTKASWGVWWEWEPRLTTYFIMTLMMVAYFVLRNSLEDEERRAVYASVFGIIAWINAPISFFITRVIPSNHPVVFTSGMATSNLWPFIVAQIGMLMIGYAVYVTRVQEERMRERLEVVKDSLEG